LIGLGLRQRILILVLGFWKLGFNYFAVFTFFMWWRRLNSVGVERWCRGLWEGRRRRHFGRGRRHAET
jgi:hypothetical protein